MLNESEIIYDLKETSALLEGHFLLSSGLHSDSYVQCAALLKYPQYAEKFGSALSEKLNKYDIDIVIGPALGGVIIAHEVARALKVPCVFTERKEAKMDLRRSFEINEGQKVLVVEDVVTTGGSVQEVIEIVQKNKGQLTAVASIVDRSGGNVDFGVNFEYLIDIDFDAYKPEECPLCRDGSNAYKPGSRN